VRFSRRFGFDFVLLAIVCIAALFLFPVTTGSYSAVHGPVTVLQSINSRLRLWLILAMAAYGLSWPLFMNHSGLLFHRYNEFGFQLSGLEQRSILRC
jgi:hypothetical protein